MNLETKIDKRFSQGNFLIDAFSFSYRLALDSKGRGIMFFVREDIPSHFLASGNKTNEVVYVNYVVKFAKC